MKSLILTLIFAITVTMGFARSVYNVVGNDVIIDLDGIGVKSNLIKVEIWTPNVVRVVSTMNEEFSKEANLIGQRNNDPIKFKVAYAQTNIEINIGEMIVNVAEDGMVRILNSKGRKLLVESNRSYEPLEKASTYKVNQKFYLNRGEHIFGFGQEGLSKRYLIRDKSFEVKQNATDIASPVFFSDRGYAFIWDNFSATKFEDTAGGLSITSDIAEDIEFFVINGPEWETILKEIRSITGQAPMLPKWAFGLLLNPNNYSNETEMQAAIDSYRAKGIPVEAKTLNYSLLKEEKLLTENSLNNELKNAYAYSELKSKFEELSTSVTDSRNVIATHINLPGIQKYGTITMAGEVSKCWESLQSQVRAGIISSFSGQAYWNTPIGGKKENSACNASNPDELNTRWAQFAAFTPVFQEMPGGNMASNNNIIEAVKLRYKLLPYIYSEAYSVYANNSTILRSLLFDYMENEKTHEIGNQYLFGKSMMVCPVVQSGATKRSVFLPEENNWINFYTGKAVSGGTTLNVDVVANRIPVFVKQGSIIPIGTITNCSADSLNAPIEIRVYGGADANFTLYEDECDGSGYTTGLFSKIDFSYTEKNKTLSIGSIEGEYPGKITERIFKVVMVSETDGIGLNETNNAQVIEYKGKKEKVKF